jgi:hypothetical protein
VGLAVALAEHLDGLGEKLREFGTMSVSQSRVSMTVWRQRTCLTWPCTCFSELDPQRLS